MKAVWQGVVIAESKETVAMESNHYFPKESIIDTYFEKSDSTTHCPWKGDASYLSVNVGDQKNKDAARYYPSPKEAAREITGMVAFWPGVVVSE
jgi:uncharacterized protein (DUF427 family)